MNATDFAQLCFLIAKGNDRNGYLTPAHEKADQALLKRINPAVKEWIQKGGIGAADASQIGVANGSLAWITLPAARSLFIRMWADGSLQHARMRQLYRVSTFALQANQGDEFKAIPVSELGATGEQLARRRASVMGIGSNDFFDLGGVPALNYFAGELRKANDAEIDAIFIGEIFGGDATPIASSGDLLNDMGDALDIVNSIGAGAASLYCSCDPITANTLSIARTPLGSLSFPEMSPTGGMLLGLPCVVSDQMPVDSEGGSLGLVNGSKIIADLEGAELSRSRDAMIEMDTAPTGDAGTPTAASASKISLFQADCSALKMNTFFGFKAVADNAAAIITGIGRNVVS